MPAAPAKTYRKADAPATGPRTPAINEADVSDKPAWVRNAPLLSAAKIRRSDRRFQDQVRSMESVNDMVVAVLRTLEETGQIGNTWIFFTSDNARELLRQTLVAMTTCRGETCREISSSVSPTLGLWYEMT